MAEPYIGDVRLFPYNFIPNGYLPCDGRLISISEYETLFVLIGTTYGGDGESTFGLPDLQGRVSVHSGKGYTLGQIGGSEAVTLSTQQIPSHTHAAQGTTAAANRTSPSGAVWAASPQSIYSTANPSVAMSGSALGASGSNQPHDNVPPFLALNFGIAYEGVYPSQG